MTSSLIVGVVFLLLALCLFASIVQQLTSKYFDELFVRRQILCAMATWGVGVSALVVYIIQLMLLS